VQAVGGEESELKIMLSRRGDHLNSNSSQQTGVLARTLAPTAEQSNADPHHARRGFFVAFAYWFGFYYFGFRQSPPRTGALPMLT
jgi:hypothetical protein